MAPIRPFVDADLDEVTSLYEQVIRSGTAEPAPGLAEYFRRTFFDHPWIDPEIPSLVYEEDGRITGFLGSHVRKVRFRGEPGRLACSGQLVTAPDARGRAPGAFLLREYMAGPQDATITDGANEPMFHLWPRLGGEILHLQSMEWIRVFRPGAVAAEYGSRERGRLARGASRPLAAAVDVVASRVPPTRFGDTPSRGTREELTPEKLVANLDVVAGSLALHPAYDESFARWLFREMSAVGSRGELFASLVREDGGQPVGWYVAYARRGAVSDVVQIATTDNAASLVLEHLFSEGRSRGVSALRGRAEPRLVNALWNVSPMLRRSEGALVQSRNTELLRAIRSGDALLTRMEGEWWMGHHLDPLPEAPRSRRGASRSGGLPPVEMVDSFQAAQANWTALAESSGNLFASLEWNKLWWRHFGRHRELRLGLVGEDPAAPDAIVPLFLWNERPVRSLRLLGHGHADLLGPICPADDRKGAHAAMNAALEAEEADLFVGDWMAGDRGWADALGGTVVRETGYPILRFEHASWDEFVDSRGRSQRKAIRYHERRLEREHEVEFREIDDPERLERDLDDVFHLHARRFGKHGDCLFCGESEQFQRDFAAVALERDWLRVLLLYVDRAPAAVEYGFQYGGAYFSYQGGRDPALDRLSVGFVVEVESLRRAFEEGIREYRYLEGEEGYKYRFPTEDPRLQTIAVPRTRRGRAALSVLETVRRLPPGKAAIAALTNR